MKAVEKVTVYLTREGCNRCECVKVHMYGSVGYSLPSSVVMIKVPRWLGLGDWLADMIHLFTRIKPCKGCIRRKHWCNRLWTWHKNIKQLLTDEEWEQVEYPAVLRIGLDRVLKVQREPYVVRFDVEQKLKGVTK